MAACADVTDPDNMLFPEGEDVSTHPINDVVAVINYNAHLLKVDRTSAQILKPITNNAEKNSSRAADAHGKFMAELRRCLARGLYVIARGWYPDLPATWSTKSVEAYKGCSSQTIAYQGRHSILFLSYIRAYLF